MADKVVKRDERPQAKDERPQAKKKRSRKSNTLAWGNIFAKIKVVVSLNQNSDNPQLIIRHADQRFFAEFHYDREDIKHFEFQNLAGLATSRLSLFRIESSILTGSSLSGEFINLYRKDGVVLSCHLSVTVMTDRCSASSTTSEIKEKFAVITIRSASVVGNMYYSGIGILGTNLVSKDALNTIGSVESRAKTKREALAKELQAILSNPEIDTF